MDTHENGWKSGDDGVYEVAMSAEDRLQAAADVVADLQARIRYLEGMSERRDEVIASNEALLADFQQFMRVQALRLALAGDYDHKDKNAVLLRVVASLLSVAANPINVTTGDDVPF